jgi:hypothetical protein
MRYVALAGPRNQKFYPGLQVFLQQEHADIRPRALDRTEKTGRAGTDDSDVVLLHGSPFPDYLFYFLMNLASEGTDLVHIISN